MLSLSIEVSLLNLTENYSIAAKSKVQSFGPRVRKFIQTRKYTESLFTIVKLRRKQ